MERVAVSRNTLVELRDGFIDGLKLALVILPTILAVGLLAIMLAENTPLFEWLGRPMEPILALLGLPDVGIIAPATLIGITEMFLPALLVAGEPIDLLGYTAEAMARSLSARTPPWESGRRESERTSVPQPR